ncbi:MAG TPA: STAS domain-containing protein, partial [Pseudonocardia sp.]|nr:STAS domain-containing protein [Pseudonocardia sp.]
GPRGTTVTARHTLRRAPILAEPAAAPVPRAGRTSPAYRSSLHRGRPTLLEIGGVVDITAEDQLRSDLLNASRGGAVDLVVDLDGVVMLASAGVRVLHELARSLGLELRASPGTPARSVLDLTRLGPWQPGGDQGRDDLEPAH